MMTLRRNIALLAWLAFFPFAVPLAAQADTGQRAEAGATLAPIKSSAMQSCLQPGDKKLNLAQVGQVQCCKDHKGVCGCRAGKIVCCDSTTSTEPGCTCHGDDGFLE